jgi:hypothetical protein
VKPSVIRADGNGDLPPEDQLVMAQVLFYIFERWPGEN